MKSKYIVLAITLLLTLSSTSMMVNASSKGTDLAPKLVDTHGPRINQIDFSVIATDSALASTLGSGGIQAAEWSFLAGSFASLKSNANVKLGKTLGYTFDGIEFNTVQPIMGNVHFRQAIAYLTNYGEIQSVSLSSVGGVASPYFLPCSVYPSSCNMVVTTYKYNLVQAAVQLSESGLTVTFNGAPITTAAIAKLSPAKLTGLSWSFPCTSTPVYSCGSGTYSPLFYYRVDDPLRTSVATLLVSAAKDIGFIINAKGITDAEAGGDIYGASEGEVISPSGYCASGPDKGYNECPVASLNETSAALAADPWDMYTFGWVASSAFTFQCYYEFASTQIESAAFGGWVNNTYDFDANAALYASTLSSSAGGCKTAQVVLSQQVPAVMSFFENYLYGDYIQGWTGYAALLTTGPNTAGGWFYTSLNAHPSSGVNQGTLDYATHGIAEPGAISLTYYPNWVWAADLYDLLFESPLATPPLGLNVANSYISWMLTGSDPAAPAGSVEPDTCGPLLNQPCPGVQVAPYSGMTPAGSFNFQSTNTKAQVNIVNGQAITFTFMKNATWADNIPVTAYDFNYSLYALNVALSPSLPSVTTPFICDDCGPFGLWATTVSNNGQSITMYLNDSSVWNVVTMGGVVVIPEHIYQFLNLNVAEVAGDSLDFSMPYGPATTALPGSVSGKAPASVTYLANLDFGTGPFWLSTVNEATGSGIMRAEVNYYRSAWYDDLVKVAPKGTATFTSYPFENVYNPGKSTNMSIAAGGTGLVNMTSANLAASNGGTATTMTCSASLQLYTGKTNGGLPPYPASGNSISVPSSDVTCNGNGQITVSISPSSLSLTKGTYEVTVVGNYNFLGAERTWYQYYGIAVT